MLFRSVNQKRVLTMKDLAEVVASERSSRLLLDYAVPILFVVAPTILAMRSAHKQDKEEETILMTWNDKDNELYLKSFIHSVMIR